MVVKVKNVILSQLIILICIAVAHAQLNTIIFETIDEDVGLPNNTVRSGFQDSDGTIWFGSLEGLIKFDGFEYASYRNNFNDTTSISGGSLANPWGQDIFEKCTPNKSVTHIGSLID